MKLDKCQLCDKKIKEGHIIKNKYNGNELWICEECLREFGFEPIPERAVNACTCHLK